jgi:Ca-activated chloride channel family protein
MSFGRPWLLVLLLAVPLVTWLYLLAQRRRMRYPLQFTNLAVLGQVVKPRTWRRFVPLALFLVALASLAVAVARPHVRGVVPREGATVILVIDVSGSMEARDVKPSRLAAAQAAARVFLERAPDRLRVGLVAFAGEPYVGAPPSTDRELVLTSLDELGQYPTFGGTAIGDALSQAVDLALQTLERDAGDAGEPPPTGPDAATPAKGLVSILFLSDGAQRRGILQPQEGAQIAKEAAMPVYTVALGTPNGVLRRGQGFFTRDIPVPPDPVTLKAIADTTGGEFFAATNAEALTSAYEKLGSKLGRRSANREVTHVFLAAASVLLVGAGLLSALWSPRLP